jgi:hypothetical protein
VTAALARRFAPDNRRSSKVARKPPLVRIALGLALAVALALTLVPAALADKGGNHGGGGGSSSVSLVMVADSNSDALPNFGDSVTFAVSTTATAYPSVKARCYQNGTLVYTHSAGFYPTYPWPQSQIFTLRSYVWTAGAADCTAELYYMNSKNKSVTLSTLDFHVSA